MFLTLLASTFGIAVLVSGLVILLFFRPVRAILHRIIHEKISGAWWRYMAFAMLVVGVSGGVRVWDLEKYITPRPEEADAITLNPERWALEIYRTVIGTLQSEAWLLLVFFVFTLIAYVITRGVEMRHEAKTTPANA
jgi:hypothetical protein